MCWMLQKCSEGWGIAHVGPLDGLMARKARGSQSAVTSDELNLGSGQKKELFRRSRSCDEPAAGRKSWPRKPQK